VLYLDNLRVHHSKRVKDFCEDNNLQLVFNIAYSPELNPIENFFSLVKNRYKRLK
jgi:transposase